MSGTTPPPDQPDDSAEHNDTVSFDGFGSADPFPSTDTDQPAGQASSKGKVVAIVAALALVAGGGAFAFIAADPLHLFKGGPQAADAVPSDALAYVGVDLDPSASQKINALRFLNHFPAFRGVSGIKDERSDVRKAIFDEALDASGCSDLSFDDDIEPWLGNKFGFAVLPGSGDEPDFAVAVEVTDQGQAAAGLDALEKCGGSDDEPFAYAESGDYVLIAETQKLADQYADDAADESLADNDAFIADMDSLGELGVATAWADIEGIIASMPAEGADLGGMSVTPIPDLDSLTASYQRIAATFRFSSDHVELVSSAFGDQNEIDQDQNEIVKLPDSTVFALSQASGDQRLAASWDDIEKAIESGGVDIERELTDFEDQTGLSIPADIETLLGDNLLLAVDSEGLTADVFQDPSGAGDVDKLNAGLRFKGDREKLDDLYQRIENLVQTSFMTTLPFSKVDFADGFVMATNDGYGKTLVDLDGNLGESEQFQSVVDDAANKELVAYFDWDMVQDQIVQAARENGATDDDIDNITPLRAFGYSSETVGDYTFSTFQMSVN
jgi:hypothetical protein